ncbi:MAG: hypothetical protein KC613_08815 [Myxococcales bacterium]|nr:hypothetical protein [Myxococcales bacterium]
MRHPMSAHALRCALIALAGSGCGAPTTDGPTAPGPDAPAIDAPAASPFAIERHRIPPRTPVDVLFVIDDSASMGEEAATLARSVLSMRDDLFEADVRFAVITTDMTDPGRMGRLQTTHRAAESLGEAPGTEDCPAQFDPVLTRQHAAHCEGEPGCVADTLRARLACMVQQGNRGDGFPQGLAALERATACDGPNAPLFEACCVDGRYDPACQAKTEFLRPDAVLAVVLVSDKDDCSMDPADPLPRETPTECLWDADRLLPTARFLDHLRSLKADPRAQILVEPLVALDPGPEDQLRFRRPTPADAGCVDADGHFAPSEDWDTWQTESWADTLARCCDGGVCPGASRGVCESTTNGSAEWAPRYRTLATRDSDENEAHLCTEGGWLTFGWRIWTGTFAAYCLAEAPACRQGVDFAHDDPGRPCTAADAAAGWIPAVEALANGRRLAPDAVDVEAVDGCPSGFLLHLADGAAPYQATVRLRYVAAE